MQHRERKAFIDPGSLNAVKSSAIGAKTAPEAY